jgi:hypothetical protein
VPQQLILKDEAGPFVWVADQSDGAARKTPVTTGGAATAGLIEVTGGLTLTSRIISRGYEALSDGARIAVVNEDTQFAANINSDASADQPLNRLPHGGEQQHGAR